MTQKVILKDPTDVIDVSYDFSATGDSLLESGETISTHSVTVDPSGTITVDSSAESGGTVTAWLSGGTVGQTGNVQFNITTSDSRTYRKVVPFRVAEQRD